MQLRNFFVDVRHFRGAQQPVRGESARKPRVAADAAFSFYPYVGTVVDAVADLNSKDDVRKV